MRKFTKGLLLTFIASAMSLGAYAQDGGGIKGYYRIINAGYQGQKWNKGVMYISQKTTAKPELSSDDAITEPGTVMFLNAIPMEEAPETTGKYEDVYPEKDLEVLNLRSQGVDASAAVYSPLVDLLKGGFTDGLKYANTKDNWKFKEAELNEIIEKMFSLMKMYMEPTDIDGKEAWYLKSTTPSTQPLVDALTEKGIEIQVDGNTPAEWAWNKLVFSALAYYESIGATQLYDTWWNYVAFEDRIHMGHTYYLIGGKVDTDLKTYQRFNDQGGPSIWFANNNKYYKIDGFMPEIEVANEAGNYAKWILEEIVEGTDVKGRHDYFAVKNGVEGFNDKKIYTTIYTDFPMKIVDNGDNTVRVWGFPNAPAILDGITVQDGPVAGYLEAVEIKDIVPARTPVVVECATTARETNLLQPTLTPLEEDPEAPLGKSFLSGIFFKEFFDVNGEEPTDEDVFNYYNMPLDPQATVVARKLVRVFNKVSAYDPNPIGFYKYNGKFIAPNKAFMILDSSMANANIFIVDSETFNALGIEEVATTSKENNTIYDIQGRVVTNPTKGLYIVNGKKMVIK
jgi:hypothetical protein